MVKEKISEYTRRISQCNRSGLTLVTYEILFEDILEARDAHALGEHEHFVQGVRKALDCLNRLMETLNFEYAVSKNLYAIYRFCRDELEMAVVKNDTGLLDAPERILRNLYEAFAEVAKGDDSKPLMQNSEKVIAGMTYQKANLTESYGIGEESRGFFV